MKSLKKIELEAVLETDLKTVKAAGSYLKVLVKCSKVKNNTLVQIEL